MDNQCHNETQNKCTTVMSNQCHNETQNKCETVNDSVCHNENQTKCETVNDSVCHNETQNKCETVSDSVCHNENQQQCHDEYRQQCQQVPQQQCVDIPHQVCENVPNMVQVPYACTKNVQVKTGDKTTNHVIAQVKVVISNFGEVDVSGESFVANLDGNDVSLALNSSSNRVIFKSLGKEQNVQKISDVDTQVTTTFTLQAISIDRIVSFENARITDLTLYTDRVRFKLSVNMGDLVSFNQAHITLNQVELLIFKKKLLDEDFEPTLLKLSGDSYEISLSSFNLKALKGRKSNLSLTLGVKNLLDRNTLLNPELLDRLNLRPITGSLTKVVPTRD